MKIMTMIVGNNQFKERERPREKERNTKNDILF